MTAANEQDRAQAQELGAAIDWSKLGSMYRPSSTQADPQASQTMWQQVQTEVHAFSAWPNRNGPLLWACNACRLFLASG